MMHWRISGEFICRWMFDTDGYTSAGLLYKFMLDIGLRDIYVGIHEGKEHGLDLKEALLSQANLVIVPDATGNPEDYVELKRKGIPSLCLDHHDSYTEEDFDSVVVNCHFGDYPNPHLSGAGVTLKFCQYYATTRNIDYDFDDLYALASIGMVADVMSLQELENQYIIRYGLKYIKNHPFFNELLKDRMGNPVEVVTVKDIGWSIGPNINATIRLGIMEEKTMLFNTIVAPQQRVASKKRGGNGLVVPVYMEMCRICKNLKARQTRLVQNAIKTIKETVDLSHNLIVYIDENEELPFELSGLIANRLLGEYKRPVLILKHFHDYDNPTAEDCWAGSMRAIACEGFEDPRKEFNEMSGVRDFSGHSLAAGSKIYKSGFDTFLAEARERLDKLDFDNQLYTVEACVPARPFNESLGKIFAAENIWGNDLEQPLMLVYDIDCRGTTFMGRESQHVKIVTPNIDFVIFDDPELVTTLSAGKNYFMRAIGTLSWNEWEDIAKLQMIVDAYQLEPKPTDEWSIYDF